MCVQISQERVKQHLGICLPHQENHVWFILWTHHKSLLRNKPSRRFQCSVPTDHTQINTAVYFCLFFKSIVPSLILLNSTYIYSSATGQELQPLRLKQGVLDSPPTLSVSRQGTNTYIKTPILQHSKCPASVNVCHSFSVASFYIWSTAWVLGEGMRTFSTLCLYCLLYSEH